MTVAPEAPTATPAQQLDQAEAQASEEIQAIITAAVAAGLSGAVILAALAPLTGAVSRAAQAGWTVGSQIVLNGARGQRARGGAFIPEPLPTSVEADVYAVVEDVARRIDAAATGRTLEAAGGRAPVTVASPAVELARFRRRMVRLATTKIHQSASAATFSFARWLDLDLEWVTRRDGKACAICAAMNGKRVPAGEKFANPHGPGIPRRLWAGFQGLPPTHPSCRCRVIVRA
ncbi:phage minor head protein [Nocardiopsis synnemataformans]|uniref:phage minor head protein n=1 Tax=Nocardiopsis synnemataformans TaxID=61305 RepID=UPI003EB73B2A